MPNPKVRTVRVIARPLRPGQCPVRPPLNGVYRGRIVNPMLDCQFKAKHKGLHSWALKKRKEADV